MNIDTFFANFGYLADAPNGVKKLREMILQLAVQGKLVPQDLNVEPASVLLAKIKAEKERLVKEKKIKKSDPLPTVCFDEIPYELPLNWIWVRFNEVFDVRDGTHDTPKYVQNGVPLVTSKNISSGKLELSNVQYISLDAHKKISERSRVDRNDILFAMIGSIGNPVIVDVKEEFSIKNVALFKYYSLQLSNPKYLCYYLDHVAAKMREESAGGVQSFVSLNYLRNYLFPLPPLAEQHRIVVKVDQLMKLCDELEARQQKKKQKLINLNNAALDRLLIAREPDDFTNAWYLLRDNFDYLYTAPETTIKLRQAILQLAVQGKLVPQDPNDEPASILLTNIKAEKERLVKEKKSRKTDTLPQISPSEAPFELPKGWEWIHLDEISINVHYGYTASADHNRKDVRLLRITDIQNGRVNWDGVPGCQIDDRNLPIYALKNNDLLIARTGGTIGKTFLVEGLEVCAVFASYLIRVIPSGFIVPRYLKQFTDSPLYWFQLYEKSMGTGQPNVNSVALRSLIFPLPSYAEQQRIVTKVNQLMKLCDELEAKLIKSQTKSEKLVEAAVKAIAAS